MNKSAPRSQDELLTELSRRLSAGADAWEAEDHGWFMRLLMAFIANWIREIAENLRHLAALVRDGKLVLPAPSAPRQRASRPASQPTKRSSRSKMPGQAATARIVPLAEPEMALPPAAAPEGASQTRGRVQPSAAPIPQNPPQPVPVYRVALAHWPGVHPDRKMAFTKPAPWHAHFVTI